MTIPAKTTTDPDLRPLADLPAVLDLAAFEQVEGTLFRAIGELPLWIDIPPGVIIDLADRFPMLELFLPQCEERWQGHSDPWTEPDGHGGECYLQAAAALVHQRRFLVLKTLPTAHDFEREKDKVERLSAELEIKPATRARSDFLARMSHEIRTPLNAVIGMADVLATTALSAEQLRCVEVLQRNGIALLNLINDIPDIARVELENTTLDLRDVVSRAMEAVEVGATAKGLWLRRSIAPATPVNLVGDPNRLRQVLIDLLDNCLKFTATGGLEIRIETASDRTPANGRYRLRFAVADTSTTRKHGGTGPDLTNSKQLVKLMGGRIWLESTPGTGSTFFFTAEFGLPAAKPEELPLTLAQLEQRSSGMRILLADDSDDNRTLILAYLRRTGSSIDVAENGAVALGLFRGKQYDVVLMDIEMPVMDGYTATRAIRAAEQETGAAATPVLALTAHAFLDLAEKGAAAGFTEILTKPIRNVTLLQALAKYNSGRNATPVIIKVAVEEGMEDVVPGYLAKRKAEIPLYAAALEKGDMDAIRGLGHRMKGTGTGYGFPALTELGDILEKAAQRADAAEIGRAIEKCQSYLNAVELEYK